MRLKLPQLVPALLALALTAGCDSSAGQNSQARSNSPAQPPPPAAATPSSAAADGAGAKPQGACALLTSDEIKAVQGEAVREMKPSERPDPQFNVALCFYQMPTFNKSVSLEVTRKGAGPRSVREVWKEQFARAEGARQAKSERRKQAGKPEGSAPARRVEGVGDEAYWVGTSFNGTIYAFKKDALVRISIGGPDKEEDRLRKLTALAQKALARL